MSDNSEEERKTGVKGAVYPQSIEEQMRISRGCMDGQIGRHSGVSDEEAAAEYERRTPEEHTWGMRMASKIINEAKVEEIKTLIEASEVSPDLLKGHIKWLIEQLDDKDHLQEKECHKIEELLMNIKNTIETSVFSPGVVSPYVLKTHTDWLIEQYFRSL